MRSFALLILLFSNGVKAQEIYVDKGECPGEGCRYGETWLARESITLLDAASSEATAILTVRPGDSVQTLTGEVHTLPGHFNVVRAEGEFEPGDEVLVYTYLGEGWFRVRHNGELKEASLGFSPWGGTAGTRCAEHPSCWGSLREELQFDWWVFVRTDAGVRGWVQIKRGAATEKWRFGQ